MKILSVLLIGWFLSAIVGSVRAGDNDNDLPRAFKDSVETMGPSWESVSWADLERAADALAGKHGGAAVPFLAKQVVHERPNLHVVECRLALFTLAKLAAKREAADALANFALDTKLGGVSQDTLLALTFAAPADARAVLENATQKALTSDRWPP